MFFEGCNWYTSDPIILQPCAITWQALVKIYCGSLSDRGSSLQFNLIQCDENAHKLLLELHPLLSRTFYK